MYKFNSSAHLMTNRTNAILVRKGLLGKGKTNSCLEGNLIEQWLIWSLYIKKNQGFLMMWNKSFVSLETEVFALYAALKVISLGDF